MMIFNEIKSEVEEHNASTARKLTDTMKSNNEVLKNLDKINNENKEVQKD